MPLPVLLGGIVTIAGVAGVGSGIHGGVKMKEASDTMKVARRMQENAIALLEEKNRETVELIDSIAKQEFGIISSFEEFSDIIGKIQLRPKFKSYEIEDINFPIYEPDELKNISVNARIILGGLGGVAAGTLGGYAASGATISAVQTLGVASTGTAISHLSGVTATNATLSAIGGGSIASGGGGMALGATVLSGTTLGVGLLVGGVIFNITGSKLSDKADEAYIQASRTEKEVEKIVGYFNRLYSVANNFKTALSEVETQYRKRLMTLGVMVNVLGKVNWSDFTEKDKQLTENVALLVGLLYEMCKTRFYLEETDNDGLNIVNKKEVKKVINNSKKVLNNVNGIS